MASEGPTFKAFSSFGFDHLPLEAVISQRMLRRLEDIDKCYDRRPHQPGCARNPGIQRRRVRGGRTRDPAARAAKTPGRKRMPKPIVVGNDSSNPAQQVSVGEAVAR